MRGSNEMELNTETMVEAVQEYFDARFKKDAPLVKRVESAGGIKKTFRVFVEERASLSDETSQ